MKTCPPVRLSRAFTLIELLVVIGIIAVISGIGLAVFGGRNTGTSLANGQLMSVSLLNSARAQAAATGRNARVLVAVDPAVESDYLRRFYVAYQEVTDQSTGTTTWKVTDNGTALAPGVYVVPEGLLASQMVTGVSLFNTGLQSGFTGSTTLSQTFPGVASGVFWYIEITPRGTLGSPAASQIVIASAQPSPPGSTPPGPRFDNPDNVRGFRISTYGIPTLANDAASFQ